jgi:hypothetical protein
VQEVNIRNLIPESLKMELAVATKVEANQEQLDQRRRLVEEKTVAQLGHIGTLAEFPVPTPILNLWKGVGNGDAGSDRRGSSSSNTAAKRLRNLTVGAIFSPESPFLPETLKETKLMVRTKAKFIQYQVTGIKTRV